MPKKIKLIILVTTVVLLGFLRDYFFLNTNDAYKTVQGTQQFHGRDEFEFMLNWSLKKFVAVKWIGTVICFFLFYFLTWLTVKIWFQNSLYSKMAALAYFGIFAASGLLFVFGYIFSFSVELYDVIHTIMMFGQSFMPLLILVLLFNYYPKTKEEQS
ncbi:MAG: hypothetical protein H6582_10990 [Crocinitomicaceae bacterium]|nr:hypothetical protein [Crocinitomicaceae bacterium]